MIGNSQFVAAQLIKTGNLVEICAAVHFETLGTGYRFL